VLVDNKLKTAAELSQKSEEDHLGQEEYQEEPRN